MKRGFSLVELSMVIAISGLMLSFVLQSKQSAGTSDCYVTTKLQLNAINTAIENFAHKNDRLPMPAARNVGVENINYGREAVAASLDVAGGVTFGALPFQALGLPSTYAGDCWGNKFTYAVTTALTTSATSGGYLDRLVIGNITLKSTTASTINTNTAYAVISHGEDGLGAVKLNYSSAGHGWCSGATLKQLNCVANAATLADGVFNNGQGAGANYFDDLILARGKPQTIANTNLYCWGTDTGDGILADNLFGNHSYYTPKQALGGQLFTQLSANANDGIDYGAFYTPCGLTADGTAYCWGNNRSGQIGDGTQTSKAVPTKVNTNVKFKKLISFDHVESNCGIAMDDTAYCWGYNGNYQILLDNANWNVTTPRQLSAIVKFTSLVTTSGTVMCGLSTTSDVYCWGATQAWGGTGNSITYSAVPAVTLVGGGHKFSAIAGMYPLCGITSAADAGGVGKIYCWGNGTSDSTYDYQWWTQYAPGRLGINPLTITNITKANPGTVTYTGAYSLTVGDKVWLQNINGMGLLNYQQYTVQAGHYTANSFDLYQVSPFSPTGIAAIDTSGMQAYTSGGQIAPTARNTPTLIAGGRTYSKLVSNQSAIDNTGQLYTWGDNYKYQYGNGLSGYEASGGKAASNVTSVTYGSPTTITTASDPGLANGDTVFIQNWPAMQSMPLAGGQSASITLANTASSVNNAYAGMSIFISAGTLAGTWQNIGYYNGSTKVASTQGVWLPWSLSSSPDNTSVYTISRSATAQAGTSNTITLDSNSIAINSALVGMTITITGGTDNGDIRTITAYNGTTKVATVSANFTTPPDASSNFTVSITGTAQGGSTAQYLILDASASAVDNYYVGSNISIGNGSNENVTVASYNGASRKVTPSTTIVGGTPVYGSTMNYYISNLDSITNPYYPHFTVQRISPTNYTLYKLDGTPLDSTKWSPMAASYWMPIWYIDTDGRCADFQSSSHCTFAPVAATQTYGGVPFTISDASHLPSPNIAVGSNGLYGWGSALIGDNTNNTGNLSPTPLNFLGATLTGRMIHGQNNVCMFSTARDLYCWGSNALGNLGNGTTNDALQPTMVSGGLKFVDAVDLDNQWWGVNSAMCAIKCLDNGASSGGNASVCCNGDVNADGVCGP